MKPIKVRDGIASAAQRAMGLGFAQARRKAGRIERRPRGGERAAARREIRHETRGGR